MTTIGKTPISDRGYSSFGEKQYQSSQGNVTVEESALKILRHQDSAAVFSGGASLIEGIFANFVQSSRFMPPQAAFDAAWMSSHDSNKDLAALFGYSDLTEPHLVKYHSAKMVGDETTSACIGNLTAEDIETIRGFLLGMPAQAGMRMILLVHSLSASQYLDRGWAH